MGKQAIKVSQRGARNSITCPVHRNSMESTSAGKKPTHATTKSSPDANVARSMRVQRLILHGDPAIVGQPFDEREEHGPYTSLADFLKRIQDRNLNKESLESLIMCGALDSFEYKRGRMLTFINELLAFNKEQQEEKIRRLTELQVYYSGHDYVELSENFLKLQGRLFREMYDANQEWVEWFEQSPDEVAGFVDDAGKKRTKTDSAAMVEMIANAFGHSPAGSRNKTQEMQNKLARSEERKVEFLTRLMNSQSEQRQDAQSQMDALWESYELFLSRTILELYAYVPKNPRVLALVSHIFLHGGIFHLLFNMLFLWLAGVILEDMWGKALYAGLFLFFGLAATFVSHLAHPDSVLAHIGASGAVAGLMGAFLLRQARAKITFMYFYMLLWRPRWGTFDAPAFVMLPLWFMGELVYGFWFDFGFVDHWAHIGGFISGAVVGAAFLITDFEKKFLGYEPVESFYETGDPNRIIAFEHAGTENEKKKRPAVMSEAEAAARKKQDREMDRDRKRIPEESVDEKIDEVEIGFAAPLPPAAKQEKPAAKQKSAGERQPAAAGADQADARKQRGAVRGIEAMNTERIEEAAKMARKKRDDGFASLAVPEKFSKAGKNEEEKQQLQAPRFEPPRPLSGNGEDPTVKDMAVEQDGEGEITHGQARHIPSPRFEGRFASGAIDLVDDEAEPEFTDGSAHYPESAPRLNAKELSGAISLGMEAFEFNEVIITSGEPDGLEAFAYGNVPMTIHMDDVKSIAAGSIERLNAKRDGRYFYDGIPDAPIYVMAIIAGQDASKMPRIIKGYFVDGERLP